jgi:hypothetical protein
VFEFIKPKLATSAKDEDELFALMVIRASAALSRRKSVEMRFHDIVSEGQQFDVDARLIRKLLSNAWLDVLAWFLDVSEEALHFCLVEYRQLLQCGDGRIHLSPFQTA